MISTLFTYSSQTMEKHLFASGFVKDHSGKMDDVANTGYVARKAWSAAGATKDFYGKLFVDMFQQPRYLISNINMRIKLIKAAYSFAISCSQASEKPKFVIESAKLYFKRIRPHPSILQNIETNLSRGGTVHYSINRIDIVSISVAANTLDISKEQLFYGRVPKMIVMAMVDNESMSGVYNKNPFNFKHNDVKHLDLKISGTSKPLLPLTPNFKGKSCLREYMSLLETMSILGRDACFLFSYEEFLNGYTFFAWNLTADYDGQPQNPARRENIRLDVKFSEVTKASINIILYAVFDSTVMINGSGEVLTDYKD